jgi:hypothetical protein
MCGSPTNSAAASTPRPLVARRISSTGAAWVAVDHQVGAEPAGALELFGPDIYGYHRARLHQACKLRYALPDLSWKQAAPVYDVSSQEAWAGPEPLTLADGAVR